MVNQCFVVTELLWAHLGSQLYPRLILKFSQRAQHPAQLNCSATAARLHAAQDERASRRAGVWASSVISPAPQEKKKKIPSFEISLALFPRRAKKFFFFLGSLIKLLWCFLEPRCFEMHLNFPLENFFFFSIFFSPFLSPDTLCNCLVLLSVCLRGSNLHNKNINE